MNTRVTGATGTRGLAESIRNTYLKYIVWHSDLKDAEAGTMTLWTMHTYVWEIASHTPYPLVTAPTSEAGKSMVFKVARRLVHNPYVAADPSPASVYQNVDELHPTFMIDEADLLKEKAFKAVLNAGFEPGTPIRRAGKSYNVFCPKIFSGISGVTPPLTEATLSRCIQIPIRRKGPNEHVTRFMPRHADAETSPIREALRQWAIDAKEELEWADPELPRELSDRQQDAWAPLLAIADMIGWGKEARKWAVTLFKAVPKPPDPAVQILHDVKRVIDSWEGARIPSAELARLRNELEQRDYEDDLTPMQLGRRLAGFGIHADASPFRMERRAASPLVRGYTLRRGGKYLHQWLDVFSRYGLNGSENETEGAA